MTEAINAKAIKDEPAVFDSNPAADGNEIYINPYLVNNPNELCFVNVKEEPIENVQEKQEIEFEISPIRHDFDEYEYIGNNCLNQPYDFSMSTHFIQPTIKINKRKSVPRKIIRAKETSDEPDISEEKPRANVIDNKIHSCETCGKSFKSKPKLIVHVRVHTGERPYLCSICQKGFRTNWTMKSHELTHLGLKPHGCELCDKKYTSKNQLKIHIRSHTGERPYSCKICQKDFKDRYKLTLHENTHTGLKPFGCDVCEKKYTTKYQLTTHKRLHMKDKLFGCKTCSRQFTERCKLALHEKTHLGLKPYSCDICDKRYRMKSHLKFHIESIHLHKFNK